MTPAELKEAGHCSVDDCTYQQTRIVRGLCNAHYLQAWSRGELGPLPARPSPGERLAAGLVVMPSGCIEWVKGGVKGYGRLRINGTKILTHRLAWELANGPITDGLYVCHKCDNPPCCNVEHMFLGDASANGLDMGNKGRGGRQGRAHCSQGHEYSVENTYMRPGGRFRSCRMCARDSNARWQAKQHAVGSAA